MYLDKMASGIDPISDLPVSDNDCIKQARISRCLVYVSGVLKRIIKTGGVIEKTQKAQKSSFAITQEKLKEYRLSQSPIPISEIVNRINGLIDTNKMLKLKNTKVISFLLQAGLIVETTLDEKHQTKIPTELGTKLGISRVQRNGINGTYFTNVYNAEAQQLILDNIDAIIELNCPKSESAELQGEPWSIEQENMLRELFNEHVPVSEIAIKMKRTNTGIRARLKRMGLIKNRGDAI